MNLSRPQAASFNTFLVSVGLIFVYMGRTALPGTNHSLVVPVGPEVPSNAFIDSLHSKDSKPSGAGANQEFAFVSPYAEISLFFGLFLAFGGAAGLYLEDKRRRRRDQVEVQLVHMNLEKARIELDQTRRASDEERLEKAASGAIQPPLALETGAMTTAQALTQTEGVHNYLDAQDTLAELLESGLGQQFRVLRDKRLGRITYDFILEPRTSSSSFVLIEMNYTLKTPNFEWFLSNVTKHILASIVFRNAMGVETRGTTLFVMPAEVLDSRKLRAHYERCRDRLTEIGGSHAVAAVADDFLRHLAPEAVRQLARPDPSNTFMVL